MLSIIIITKNEEKCLPRILDSLVKQNYQNFEVIVSDAQSTDRTREIAEAYGCRIVDGGLPSVGRNNGARVARGELLLFLDADVVLPRDFLKKSIEEFNRSMAVCAASFFRPISERVFDKLMFSAANYGMFIMQHFAPYAGGACIFVKKEIFNQIGGFNEQFVISEDHAFVRDCFNLGKFKMLKDKPIFLDVRRFDNDGRINIVIKYIYEWSYKMILGDYSRQIINYKLHGETSIKEFN
ncbi:glycosyltransferase [Candidatus Pacearchaeota archaeon]|nr:glycosyltransferase [Candidatus Pacearchaeota archaeon]